jgi:predicted deacylase
MMEIPDLFPRSYDEARGWFRHSLARVQDSWPAAQLASHSIPGEEDLTIDWITADAGVRRERLLIFTTGEHGIEGYVGAAMLRLFLDEVLRRLEPASTGLLLVHAINPWGMKHHRRTNRDNVDLNRNFAPDRGTQSDPSNPNYERLDGFLNPKGPIRSLFWANVSFYARLLWNLATLGPQRLQEATLLGQLQYPQGLYYGGEAAQAETRLLASLFQQHVSRYDHIVLLDMHTGYGPRHQMTLVGSCLEPRDPAEIAQRCRYPLVVRSDVTEFYSIMGDMVDWLYDLVGDQFPDKKLFATSFEFGTLGDSLPATIRSLQAMIFENRLFWHGAETESARESIHGEFEALFFPSDPAWQAKAIADARQAMLGILRCEGFIPESLE